MPMQIPTHAPSSGAPAQRAGGGRAFLLACGLATSGLTLAGVYVLNAAFESFQIMSWYLNYVFPAGALLVGVAASSGYGLGSWLKGVKLTAPWLAGIAALQVAAYFAAQYLEFASLTLVYEDGTPVDFLSYFELATTGFAWVQDDGSLGEPLGRWGYALRALEIAGFSCGSLAAPLLLRSKAYCDRCSRYMQSCRQAWLPASVPAQRIKKQDLVGREAHERAQQEALDAGLARVAQLCERAEAGDAAGFEGVLGDPSIDAKGVTALPVRISIAVSRCPGCEGGLMQIASYTGQGQQQRVSAMGKVALRPHFAREVAR
jgi:hypothetical protein